MDSPGKLIAKNGKLSSLELNLKNINTQEDQIEEDPEKCSFEDNLSPPVIINH